jgi:flagellar hook assembly protein FlgD
VVKEAETATLTIYDMKGRTISAETYEAGEHAISWDATEYGSGVYFYKLASPSCHEVKKMIMLK